MKVLLINGSPHAQGCTYTALSVVADELQKNGVETEIVHVGHKDIRGCIGCYKCRELGRCVFDKDVVNELSQKFAEADGLVVGSPVYYAGMNGTLNYYSAETENLDITVNGNEAVLRGRSRVTAAVFGGGRHTWRLQLLFHLHKDNSGWLFTRSEASTY